MKYTYKLILSTLLVFFLVAGCDTEELHNLNINPQAVNEIDLHYLFSAAELSMASGGASGDNRFIDWRTNIGLASTAIQHLATTGGITTAGMYYRHNEETCFAPFDWYYPDPLKNIAEVIDQTSEGGFAEGELPNTVQAARIIKVFYFQRLTDFYGPVPYTEANKGLDGTFFPAYDNQSLIYPDLLATLEDAVSKLSASANEPGFEDADMIFQGNIDKWKKFGNSLMLRSAMRVSNVDAALANEYVSKAVQGGVMTSNEDNVWIPMSIGPSEWQDQNGISRAFDPGDGGNQSYLSERFINFLKGDDLNDASDDDPRLMIFTDGIGEWSASSWNPVKQDPVDQMGFPSGYYQATVAAQNGWPPNFLMDTTYSRISPYILDDDDPYIIMNYAEVEFLLAEALERGIGSGIQGTAEQHYNNGVRAAMQMWEPMFGNNEGVDGVVTDAEVDAYLAAYPYGGPRPALEMIGEQMWVSKFFNWWEAWSDWKRTDYPTLVAFSEDDEPSATFGNIIPVRLRYPTSEVANNPNFDRENLNNYTSPVWWDGGSE